MADQLMRERSGTPAEATFHSPAQSQRAGKYLTNPDIDSFVLSFEKQSLRNKKKRYYWTICSTRNPNLLVSWGHAPTHAVAENEARNELEDLTSGRTQGGRVASSIAPSNRRTVGGINVVMPPPSIVVLSDSKGLY